MSKKEARRIIASSKHGCTVKEFLLLCNDMGFWFDEIQNTVFETVYYTLKQW